MKRIYEDVIAEHFQHNKQMAFVCGPRQVGKTTIARALEKRVAQGLYRTWDSPSDQVRLLANSYEPILEGLTISPATHPLLILDEIHKFIEWKNYLKGLYDTYQGQLDLLITGSARLNVFRKGGDSLMGRYFLYRVHPLSVGEIVGDNQILVDIFRQPKLVKPDLMDKLLGFGGFPEPFSKGDSRFLNQWQHLRKQQLIYEDIRSLEAIQNLAQLELLSSLISHQAGQLINYSSLASKVRVSAPTIQKWLSVLEQVYYCFFLRPWTQNITRTLIKEPKIYLYDWSQINDVGLKHENFVASNLLKSVNYWTDIGLGSFDLYFIRTKDQVEIDFLVTKNSKPWMIIEVKSSAKTPLSKALKEYQDMLACPFAFQIVFDLPSNQKTLEHLSHVIEQQSCSAAIIPAGAFFSMLV